MKIYYVSILIILIASCSQKDCPRYDDFPEFDNLEGITGVEVIDIICLSVVDLDSIYVINNDSEYQMLADYVGNFGECENYVLPTIDFEEKTLLANHAFGGCIPTYEKKIVKTDSIYIYYVKVYSEGTCYALTQNMNWVLIPKILPSETVQFRVSKSICY